MAATYALWDMVSANLITTFATQTEALTYVRRVIDDGQRDLVVGWALGWEDARGRGKQIAAGDQLINRALTHVVA